MGFEFWDAELREVLKGPDMVGMVKIGIFLATVFGIGVYAVYKIWQAWRSLFWFSARQMQGQCITPEACPALWELVREVAECAKAQPPDTIVLGMEPTFFVMAGDVDLYPEGERYSGNMLYLSLPFMLYLTRDELISVVVHELGQFDNASENERDTVPERPGELVNLVQLAAGPDGVLTFIRHVLQEQRDLRERGEQAWTDPLRTLHNALQGAVPHPLDTHPLTVCWHGKWTWMRNWWIEPCALKKVHCYGILGYCNAMNFSLPACIEQMKRSEIPYVFGQAT